LSVAYFDRERVVGFSSDLTHAILNEAQGTKHYSATHLWAGKARESGRHAQFGPGRI